MKPSALVGYTGFVGGNILIGFGKFDFLFNSTNFSEINGKEFGLVIFAAASATKWLANKDPLKDRAHIDELIAGISTISAERFVLISTIDVYKYPVGVDERDQTDFHDNHAYGKNRGRLEEFVQQKFKVYNIIRLPGLFGPGIKKNVIYDFINNNQIGKIDSRGSFQFYNLDYIARDINKVIAEEIPLINLAVEPVTVADVYRACFNKEFINEVTDVPAAYDFRSQFSLHWQADSQGYLYNKKQCLAEISSFVKSKQ
jgi:hypothetical protein